MASVESFSRVLSINVLPVKQVVFTAPEFPGITSFYLFFKVDCWWIKSMKVAALHYENMPIQIY